MIAVLFARRDSIYKTIPGLDVFDIDRDARNWRGGSPCIAHPPCRGWGRMQHMAKPREDERELAPWAVDRVRLNGGVLEHPAHSELCLYCALPAPGHRDLFGGFTIGIHQHEFGHRAEKATILYVCGLSSPNEIPDLPPIAGRATHTIDNAAGLKKGMQGFRPHVSKAEREKTPTPFAFWLVELARRCKGMQA